MLPDKSPQLNELPRIIKGLANLHGDGFFEAITRELAHAIAADYVFIGILTEGYSKVRTIAVCHEGQSVENFTYPLADTPCSEVASSGACAYPENVSQLYPRDELLQEMGIRGYLGIPLLDSGNNVMGLLVALFKSPIESLQQARWIFDLFAGRVSAELENQGARRSLQELNQELASRIEELDSYKQELESRVAERTAELELQKQSAEQANSAKTAFLAMMSHEVRTPLNGVLGMAELLANSHLDDEQQEYVRGLQQSGSSLMHVVNDILDYSRVASGDFDLAPESVDIVSWLKALIAPYRTQVDDAVTLTLELAPDLRSFYCFDEHRVQQLLSNLLSNASKFTKKGEICLAVKVIEASAESSRIEFSVRDSGIGIPAEAMQRIFQPFSQADNRVMRDYGGTGLGLSLCQMIVTRLGGNLEVSSREGTGSIFSFALDFAHSTAPEQVASPAAIGELRSFAGLSVMVVDDNLVNLRLVKAQLAMLGIEASLFSDVTEALALLETPARDVDIVLMDCEMPVINGFEATKRIRIWEAKTNTARIPVYALTAHALDENEVQCREAGMDGRLTKPIAIEHYLPVLNKIFAAKG